MSEEFYLKPFDFSYDTLGNISFHGIKVLKAISKNRFEIDKILNKCNETKNYKSEINLKNYSNFVDRLKKITQRSSS